MNLVEIDLVVFKILEVEIGKILVRVNKHTCVMRNFLNRMTHDRVSEYNEHNVT